MLALLLSLSLASATDDAVAAFKRGRELLAQGRLAEACAAFGESHRLDPALGALLNLAECTASLNDRPKAFSLYGEVLAWATRKGDQKRVDVARERLAALRPQLALALVDTPPDAVVLIDRVRVATGQTVPLDPGPHVVELRRGDASETRTLTVSAGETVTLLPSVPKVAVTPREPAPALVLQPAPHLTPPSVTSELRPPSRVGPLSLLIGGGAVLLGGAVLTGWSVDVWNRGETQRNGGPLTVTQRTYELAGTLYPLGIGGLVVGSLLLVGSVVWWLSSN